MLESMAKAEPIKDLDPCAPAAHNARLIALQRLEELYHWSQAATNPQDVESQHHLRIAVKRLRYTLELFQAVLPEACLAVLPELEQLQEELGRLHDHDVLLALIKVALTEQQRSFEGAEALLSLSLLKALQGAPLPLRAGLRHLLWRLQRERAAHFQAFSQHWQALEARRVRQELRAILQSQESAL